MAFSPGNVKTYKKSELFVPASAAEERELRETVAGWEREVKHIQECDARLALLNQKDKQLTSEISTLDREQMLRRQRIEADTKELEALKSDLAKREQQQPPKPAAGKMPVAAQTCLQSSSSCFPPIPEKGPQRNVVNALARMVLFNDAIPSNRVTEEHRQAAREKVWPFVFKNDPLNKGPITLHRDKRCAQLTAAGIGEVVVPLIQKLKKCDFAAFKNEIAVSKLMAAVKDLSLNEIHFGGLTIDKEANGTNTSLIEADLVVLAQEVHLLAEKGRKLSVTFDEESQNQRFQELLAKMANKTTSTKTPPAVPTKPVRHPAAVAIPIATGGNTALKLVPDRGSPPKGQA